LFRISQVDARLFAQARRRSGTRLTLALGAGDLAAVFVARLPLGLGHLLETVAFVSGRALARRGYGKSERVAAVLEGTSLLLIHNSMPFIIKPLHFLILIEAWHDP
jgi:hypothetical protein